MPYKDKAAAIARSKKYYQSNKDHVKSYQKEYRKNNKLTTEQQREVYFKYTYGITIADYNKILEEQNFCCAICEKHISELNHPLFVDHDHTTNEIRGLLCRGCNTGLGLLKDSIIGLEQALNYLKRGKINE